MLGSGSSGNATVVHSGDGAILVDAGFSGKEVLRRMELAQIEPADIRAVLVTHEHQDHSKGAAVLARRWDVPLYANRATAEAMSRRCKQMPDLRLFMAGQAFEVDPFRVAPFTVPHDASDPVAFTVHLGETKIGMATDIGHVNHVITHHLRECDALVLECNHDIEMLRESDRPWKLKRRILSRHGHLSNEAGVELMREVLHFRTRHIVLAHASRECNRYELIETVAANQLAASGRTDMQLAVARQDIPTETCWIARP